MCTNISQSTNYSDSDDDNNGSENDISDSDYEDETSNKIYEHLPSVSQISMVARLIGKREYVLCRNGTKKFFKKLCQYQELAQIDKANDVNYGSRMGQAAEILCKLAGICEIMRISIEALEFLRSQNQLHYEDTSLTFIRNVSSFIENKYPSSNTVLEIQSSSCDLAGHLVCSHLLNMLLVLYNIEPIVPNVNKNKIDSRSIHSTMINIRQRIFQYPQLFFVKRDLTGSMGLLRHFSTDMVNTVIDELVNYELIRRGQYINATSRAIVHMKAFPSKHVLNDPIKHNLINQLFQEVKLSLTIYMSMLCNSRVYDDCV
ncbi:unnamed protein product [Rotaria sp. Silwood2]|nr:unnamed protein product [Rotaria sp. Silwood2]